MLGLISFDFRVGHHLRFTRQTVDIAPTQSQVCGYLLLAGLKLYFYLFYLYSSSDARLHKGIGNAAQMKRWNFASCKDWIQIYFFNAKQLLVFILLNIIIYSV